MFEVTSGEDASPALPAPSLPDPVCLQQARADRAEQEAKEHKNKDSWPCSTRKTWFDPTGLYSWHCIGILWYATNEVDRDASMLMQQQKCAGAQRGHTCAHKLTHTYTHTHTHMHRRTHSHRHTHAQTHMHMRAHTHTHTHMHTHKHTHTYTYTHTHTHNLHRYQVSGGFDGICCPRSCCLCRASSSSIHFIGCQPASFGVGAGPRDGSLGGVVCLSISSIIRCSLSSCKGMSMVQVCVSYRSMCASKAIRLE